MTTPLTARLPLRRTSALSEFDDARPIPVRYGEVAGELLQFSADRRTWIWADHASEGIDEVRVDDRPAVNWDWRNSTDASGSPVTVVEFTDPVADGASVSATGRGRLHPTRGGLMTNPATVVWDIRAAIGGQAIAESDVRALQLEADRLGITVAGSLTDDTQTIGSAIGEVLGSIDALWSPETPGLGLIHRAPGTATATADGVSATSVESEAQLSQVINDLTIEYAADDSGPTAALRLESAESIRTFGRRRDTLRAPWIASARVADAVGRRHLQRRARPTWVTQIADLPEALRVGDTVDVQHPTTPHAGPALITSADRALGASTTSVAVSVPAGTTLSVRLINRSAQTRPETGVTATVSTKADTRELTIRGPNGSPISGARALLDGTVARTTDSAGVATFPVSSMPAGQHTLEITAAGLTWTITVQV